MPYRCKKPSAGLGRRLPVERLAFLIDFHALAHDPDLSVVRGKPVFPFAGGNGAHVLNPLLSLLKFSKGVRGISKRVVNDRE